MSPRRGAKVSTSKLQHEFRIQGSLSRINAVRHEYYNQTSPARVPRRAEERMRVKDDRWYDAPELTVGPLSVEGWSPPHI